MRRRTFINTLGAGALTPLGKAQQQDPLYLLTYDHGGLVLWGIPHFTERLHEAIAWLDRYPGFKIGLDNEAYTYDYLAAHSPAMIQELRGYLTRYAGRFGIGTCTYGQPLSCFISEESNIRQLEYGLGTTRKYFGRAPEIYLMSEHAMHCQLPQILAGFGMRGAIMRTHYMMYGYNPTFDVPYGWWTGLDGSRIPAVPTYPGEGSEFGRTTYDNWVLTRCPGRECKGSLEEFVSRFGHIRPLIATRADDSGLRREDLVKLTEARKDTRWVLLEDLPSILPRPAADMKTGANDFVVRMPWGYCGNEIFNKTRQAEVAVTMAERLAALELLLGGANREADLDEAWKNVLVAQHHDIQICGLLPDARKFLGASLAASERVTDAAIRAVAARMKGGEAGQITVFNPSSWPRREWVETTITLPARSVKNLEVRHGGKVVPSVVASAFRSSSDAIQEARLLVLADVPPLAAASYSVFGANGAPVTGESPFFVREGPLRMDTPFWRIEMHPDGGIAALTTHRGEPVIAPGRRSAFFAGRVNGKPCESQGRWRILPRTVNLPWLDLREEGTVGGIPYRSDLRLHSHSPRLDYRVRFEFEQQMIGQVSENKRDSVAPFVHEEKLRFKVFPAAADAIGVRDLPFAVAETSDRYVQGNHWTAVAGAQAGVAFFNRGAMGAVRESDGGFSLPLAYSMYYIWGTRILNGEYEYEFAMFPFTGAWKGADLHRKALEYNYPMPVCAGDAGNGSAGELAMPCEFSSEDVIATALYSKAGKVHLRMFEHRGNAGRATVRRTGGSMTEVDLTGRTMGSAGTNLDFHSWQIRTVRLD